MKKKNLQHNLVWFQEVRKFVWKFDYVNAFLPSFLPSEREINLSRAAAVVSQTVFMHPPPTTMLSKHIRYA